MQCTAEIGSVCEKAIVEAQADLVNVGVHMSNLKDRIIGPNAPRVGRDAPVSVLVVRL